MMHRRCGPTETEAAAVLAGLFIIALLLATGLIRLLA